MVDNPPFPLIVSFNGQTVSPFKAVMIPAAPAMSLIHGLLELVVYMQEGWDEVGRWL